jgi:hypothetical protein
VAALWAGIIALPAHAATLRISPLSGDQFQQFTVSGEGLPPGLLLDISVISPHDEVFSTVQAGRTVIVTQDGRFEVSVVPSSDFQDQVAGIWAVQVCIAGTDECAEGEFEVTP